MARRALSEFLGTALLVMAVVGSGIMAQNLTKDVALQLLANAIATGGALLGLITIFGPLSGASFNPVVSLVGYFVDRESSVSVLVTDVVAQVSGAIVGCVIANIMFAHPFIEMSTKVRTGGPTWFFRSSCDSWFAAGYLGREKGRRKCCSSCCCLDYRGVLVYFINQCCEPSSGHWSNVL